MPYTTLYFDLDDTLYDPKNGLWEAIRDRMTRYMVERLAIAPEDVAHLRQHYYETYGTTLRGLQKMHEVDPYDFLAYVHDLPLNEYLRPDPGLRQLLSSLPQRRWIFTNADAPHATRVLAQLELSDCFEGVIDLVAVEFACKPEQQAYQRALALAGEADPGRCVFLDDSTRNLAPARALGFCTVLVGSEQPDPAACISIRRLADLSQAFPSLWENGG